MPVMEVERIDWSLPPGCAGLVGFYVSMGGVQVQPLPQGAWVTGDGLSGSWALSGQPNSGAWELTAYNTGAYPHAVHLTFHVALVEQVEPDLVLLPNAALSRYSSQLGGWHG